MMERLKDFSPKILTDIMVLTTQAKEVEGSMKQQHGVAFWDSVESHLGHRMKDMSLEELLNLLWSTLEVGRGGKTFLE